ncbi:ATP-grasp domain-containing protein [Sporosarcina sp. CAU 1771]
MNYLRSIVFIGTNKSGSSREAIKAAEKMGYFTVVFTNNEKQLIQREAYKDVHEMILIGFESLARLKKEIDTLQLKGREIKAIVSFIDSNVHLASILSDIYCQNKTSSSSIKIMEDKAETRTFLEEQPYTPKFIVITPKESEAVNLSDSGLLYPVMVKSSISTGSKDVLLAKGKKQLNKCIKRISKRNPTDSIIVEEYIEGEQYLVEALIHDNTIQIAGIIKQEITQGKRFIITGYAVLATVPNEIRDGIEQVLNSIVKQFGIENGALHLELRLCNSGWKLIEINPRISGGAMNKMIEAAFGFNLVEETLKLYIGETPSLKQQHKNYVFTQYVIVSKQGILEKVTGKARARKSPGVVEVYVKPRKGTKLIPPLSMGHRYAYVIATGDSLDEAKQNAKNAAKEIEFHLTED